MDATAEQPQKPARVWIGLAIGAALVFAYLALTANSTPQPLGTQGSAIGRSLGFFHLEGLTGAPPPVSLDDLQGRVSVVSFFGTWCVPCLREFPHLAALAEKYHQDDNFRLYIVSCGEENDETLDELRAATESFLSTRQSKLPTWSDQHASTRRAMIVSLGLDELPYPTTLVLDRQGKIRGFWQGYEPRAVDEMAELVAKLLGEQR